MEKLRRLIFLVLPHEQFWIVDRIVFWNRRSKILYSCILIFNYGSNPILFLLMLTSKDKKLFIFDEIGKAMKRRRPMASLNIKLIDQFHVLRKYKLSTVATTISEKYVDTAILGSDILDGYFRKPSFRNRKLAYYVDYLEPFEKTIIGLPSTSIDFDTWDSAPFQEHGKQRKPHFKDKDLNVLWEWSHGATYKEVGLHRMEINRLVRKFIRSTLESKSQVT